MMLPIALIATSILACGKGGPGPDEVPLQAQGDSGSDTGSDTGTASATGVAGVRGSATVQSVGPDFTYEGTEEIYFESIAGDSWCSILSDVAVVDLGISPCKDCDWSFTLQTSNSQASAGCAVSDASSSGASSYDGATFSYGYIQGKKYGTLAYYYDGYGWYGTYADASWDDQTGDFLYDWPVSNLYGTY
ncbi:MAG: hypothetical protein GXP62_18545 [Oligoflexia bacterium]|nr:hypothetical protein [Oligoflexia bacterium]